jgi:hypothetical protein
MLQWRRFFLPAARETRGFRRIVSPGIISVLGLALVFVTFVFKEVLQENAKSTVSALQAARTAFEAENNRDSILDAIRDSKDKSGLEFFEAVNDAGRESLSRLRTLLASLPQSPAFQEFVRSHNYTAPYEALHDDFNLVQWENRQNPNMSPAKLMDLLGPAVSRFQSRIKDFEKSVIVFFEGYRKEAQKKLRSFTYASYACYTVAFFVGVVGELCKANPPKKAKWRRTP